MTAQGNPGHGSRFIKATAVEKLVRAQPLRGEPDSILLLDIYIHFRSNNFTAEGDQPHDGFAA